MCAFIPYQNPEDTLSSIKFIRQCLFSYRNPSLTRSRSGAFFWRLLFQPWLPCYSNFYLSWGHGSRQRAHAIHPVVGFFFIRPPLNETAAGLPRARVNSVILRRSRAKKKGLPLDRCFKMIRLAIIKSIKNENFSIQMFQK